MTIWIMAILLMGLFGLMGYYQGAIRAAVSLLGLVVGLFLALPLAPQVKGLVPMVGLAHPVWSYVLPPVIVVIAVECVFLALSYAAYRPISLHFKYKVEDAHRMAWERLMEQLGIGVGILSGAVHMVAIGVLFYGPGYLSTQVAADDKDPVMLKFVNRVRTDMQSSGLDKLAARFDPMPKKYYEVADLLGLLYNNPLLKGRVSTYPPLYTMGERQEFQDMAKDQEFHKMLGEQASAVDILTNPRILGIINNPEVVQALLALDLKDFRQYLEKGQSPLYDPFKVLGRWELDVNQVIIMAKKAKPDMTGKELRALQNLLRTAFTQVTLTATWDQKVVLKGMVADFSSLTKAISSPPPTPAAAPAQAEIPRGVTTSPRSIMSSLDRRMAMDRRYGAGYSMASSQPQPQAAAPAAPPPPEIKVEAKTFEGTWEGEGDRYTMKFAGAQGAVSDCEATVEGDALVAKMLGQKLVFLRTD